MHAATLPLLLLRLLLLLSYRMPFVLKSRGTARKLSSAAVPLLLLLLTPRPPPTLLLGLSWLMSAPHGRLVLLWFL